METFFIGTTLAMALLAGGALALLFHERQARDKIIDSQVLKLIKHRNEELERHQQQLIDTMMELENLRRQYNDRVNEMAEGARLRRSMLVVEGADSDLHWDMVSLEQMGFLVETLRNPTTDDFKAKMDAARAHGAMPYYVHFSMHANENGVGFRDKQAAPLWLNRQLRGARHVSLATCDSDVNAYKMRLVAGSTLCFVGDIESDAASRFVRLYYEAIFAGRTAREALWKAKASAPAEIADVALMV